MNKKFAAVGLGLVFSLTNCSGFSASAAQLNTPIFNRLSQTMIIDQKQSIQVPKTLLEKQAIKINAMKSNSKKIDKTINSLYKYVGRTWYVFSGSTPSGWDCSGLVMWTYDKLGIELYHGASVQKNSGTKVKTPKNGDIVAFSYKNSKGAFHVGIYIGNGKMIHAGGKRGEKTSIVDVSKWAKANGSSIKVTYTRILETI